MFQNPSPISSSAGWKKGGGIGERGIRGGGGGRRRRRGRGGIARMACKRDCGTIPPYSLHDLGFGSMARATATATSISDGSNTLLHLDPRPPIFKVRGDVKVRTEGLWEYRMYIQGWDGKKLSPHLTLLEIWRRGRNRK